MVDLVLLQNTLKQWEIDNKIFIPLSLSEEDIQKLLDTSEEYQMTEDYYCCYGLEQCCWQELIEEGVWKLTKDDVLNCIIEAIDKGIQNNHDGDRCYFLEGDTYFRFYIYLRDLFGLDYHIIIKK